MHPLQVASLIVGTIYLGVMGKVVVKKTLSESNDYDLGGMF